MTRGRKCKACGHSTVFKDKHSWVCTECGMRVCKCGITTPSKVHCIVCGEKL